MTPSSSAGKTRRLRIVMGGAGLIIRLFLRYLERLRLRARKLCRPRSRPSRPS